MGVDDYVRRLMSDARRVWQDPVKIAKDIGIGEGMTVADLGCGPGFFVLPIASMVGEKGKVYAVDADPAMLHHLRIGIERCGMDGKRVKVVEADISRTGIPSGSVDVTLLANILHDVEDRKQFLKEVRRISKPEATVVDVDWRKVQSENGPPLGIRLSKEESMTLLSEGGFRVRRSIYAGPYHYGIVCEVPKQRTTLHDGFLNEKPREAAGRGRRLFRRMNVITAGDRPC